MTALPSYEYQLTSSGQEPITLSKKLIYIFTALDRDMEILSYTTSLGYQEGKIRTGESKKQNPVGVI